MLTRAAWIARTFDRAHRREADGLAQQRVPGDMEVAAFGKPRLVDLLGPELDGDAPVRAHRALAGRVDERDDDAVSGRLDRPEQVDAEVAQPRGRDGARVVGAPLADECGLPPRAAIHAATFAAWPPGRRTIWDVASAPVASGCSRRTITSRTRSPRQKVDIAYDPRMEAC